MMTIDQTLKIDLLKTNNQSAVANSKSSVAATQSVADIDQHLVASSKQVLLKSIDFHPAEKDISFQLHNLRMKYVALNPSQSDGTEESKAMPGNNHSQMNGQVDVHQDGIPAPKKVLYPSEKILLAWQRCQRVGPGLINMGNTCFLNATLQCLMYTPPLTNYLLTHQHKNECRELGFCIMCELCNHVHRAFNHQQNGQAIRPMVILHKLKHFAKHMHIGRQEDAHEFLRLLIEAMQKSCIRGFEKLDKYSKETSLVYQIFSGYYRSRVICSVCQNKSDTFDPFLDIGLDIKQAPSVTKALERLIRPEMLDGENLYQCKKCNRKVQAQKRFTIQRAPTVLTLCLKRFDFNRFSMGKINKDLAYSDCLNLRPYMSDPKGQPIMYELYAVLKHEGASCNSGHYYCFVKAANQSWYCMNDAFVSQVSLQRVLNQNAYLLFYIRNSSFKSPINGGEQKRDVLQTKNPKPATTISKPTSLFNGPVGVPVPRPSTSTQPLHQNAGFKLTVTTEDKRKILPQSSQQQQQEKKQQQAKHNLPRMVPLPLQREKLSFPIRAKGAGPVTAHSHVQQPLLVTSKQLPTASSGGPTIKSPVNAGAGDATMQAQPEESAATAAFSPLRTIQTSPPALGSPKTPSNDSFKHIPGLVKPKGRLTQDASNMNGICKKQAGSGLVPYSAEDSNSSSSDSDTNYDQVAAELSRTPAGDVGTHPPKITDNSEMKTDNVQSDATIPPSKVKENQVDSTPMKPPATAKTLSSDTLQLSPTHLKKAGLANSVNLTSIRKPDSPLKLTITTNGQAQRVKATSHWRTVDSDLQISPSPASDCSLHSNVSTNSTSEWNILEKKDAPQTPEEIKKEAAVFGWNITPSKCKNSEKLVNSKGEQRTTFIGPRAALNFDEVQDQTQEETEAKGNLSQSQEINTNSSSTVDAVKDLESICIDSRDKLTDNGDFKKQQSPLHSKETETFCSKEKLMEQDTREKFEEGTSIKKKKKHKKQHLSPSDESHMEPGKSERLSDSSRDLEETVLGTSPETKSRMTENGLDSSNETAKKHKKKKKKKKKKKDKVEEEEELEPEEEWVERVVEPLQHDDQELLLNDSESQSEQHKQDRHKPSKHKSSRIADSQSEEETNHKHSESHRDKKRKEKHSLIRRTLEKKMNHHRKCHSSDGDKCRESSSRQDEHWQESRGDSYHKRTSNRKRTHGDHTSFYEHSKHHKESRKRHSSDNHSSADYPAKVRLLQEESPVVSRKEKRKKKPKDSGRHSHSSDSSSTLKHTKTHKEQRNTDSVKDSKYVESWPRLNGDDELSSHRREKKKKRKHIEEVDDKRPLLHSDKDEDYRPEKKKKKKKKHRSSDGEEDSTGDNEVATTKYEAPVQQWDHHIQESHRRHSNDNGKPSKILATWDGTHSTSGVVEELAQSSLKAYGPSIKSWDGGCSALDNQVEQDSRTERQRDPYEEDFDRGKVKKVKKHHDDRQKIFSGRHNPFQSMQNMRNKLSFDKNHHGYSHFSNQSHGEHPR